MKTIQILSTLAITVLSVANFSAQKTSLNTGEVLKTGQTIVSKNGTAIFQAMVVKGKINNSKFCSFPANKGIIKSYLPISCVGKLYPGEIRIEMWNDGNLVVKSEKDNSVLWASSTTPSGDPRFKDTKLKPTKMVVEDNGLITLQNAQGEQVWYHNINIK